MVEIYAVK